jgi:cytochrome P450
MSTTTSTTSTLNVREEADAYLADPSSRRNPYGFYDRIREHSPVHQTSSGVWLISGYEEAGEALRNDDILSRREAGLKHVVVDDPESRLVFTSRMLYNDRPEHTRLRRLVSYAFTRQGIAGWEGRIREVANQRLDTLVPRGRMDLAQDFAYPVVEQIITELLGIRAGDLPMFMAWSAAMTEPPPGGDLGQYREAANTATKEVTAYVRDRIEERRLAPGEDILSRLIAAESEDGKLAEHELVAMTFELIFAGHETTSNFVPNGMLCLLERPQQLKDLLEDRSLLPSAIDEMLRFESPAPMPLPRVAIEDIEIGGQLIKAGDTIVVLLAAANRDPKAFTQPEVFDIRRTNNDFISFGFGAHYCLGQQLARLESSVLFNALLERIPGIHLDGEAKWSDHQFFRSLISLPVAW